MLATAPNLAWAVGFQSATTVDVDGDKIPVDIWYPSQARPQIQSFGPFHPSVAIGGAIAGRRLPLIIISHGTGGSALSHYDTALALAEAGFVVATFDHPGDNYADQSRVGLKRDLIDRPRQVHAVLDYLLKGWTDRGSLDPEHIGMFGYSLGGFTTLVTIGGVPDLSRMPTLCRSHPEAPDCSFIRDHHGDQLNVGAAPSPDWLHDTRVKAAVIVAPAASFDFGPGSLSRVHVPVQLWIAANDHSAPVQWNSGLVRRELASPPESHVVAGAGHLAFLAPEACSDAPPQGCEGFHKVFNRAVVAFFEEHLIAPAM
jgi:predicted dienelactone hydrolase